MGDDPYDFEIALPAAPANVRKSTRSHRDSSDSDEDISDASGSLSNMSGISSHDNSGQESDHNPQKRSEPSFKKVTKSAIEPKSGASSRALDRAKNFLSKYSSATSAESNRSKAPTRSRSRRISLALDDDDEFSFESSSGGEKEDFDSKKANPTITNNIQDSGSSQGFQQQVLTMETTERHEGSFAQSDQEDESQSSDPLPPYSGNKVVAVPLPVSTTQLDDHSIEAADSIDSFHSGESNERSRVELPRPALRKPDYHDQHEESVGDYGESFQEESLSQELDTKQTRCASAFSSIKPHQSVASESGAYEEEAFEEDSVAVAPALAQNLPITQPVVNSEKNFDYSMDFSDDENEEQTEQISQVAINEPVQEESAHLAHENPESPSQGDISPGTGEQSAFLESNSICEVGRDEQELGRDASEPSIVTTHSVKSRTNADNNAAQSTPFSDVAIDENKVEPTSAAHNLSMSPTDTLRERLSSNTSPTPAGLPQSVNFQQSKNTGEVATTGNRRHVEIVRAYRLEEDKCVEMKDASTQFTGNHAAIQTDLVPDGMHNIITLSAPTPPLHSNDGQEREAPQQQQPPPPPLSSAVGASMYSLDALKLPMAASTSLYRQQLLALQEQILEKKRETERIVQDRMAFQYSSLRGTERFIAARRAQKLELWEALMRVDPTLDERKAREAARLAQAAST